MLRALFHSVGSAACDHAQPVVVALLLAAITVAAAAPAVPGVSNAPPPFTSPAEFYSGISGPGAPVVDDGKVYFTNAVGVSWVVGDGPTYIRLEPPAD